MPLKGLYNMTLRFEDKLVARLLLEHIKFQAHLLGSKSHSPNLWVNML